MFLTMKMTQMANIKSQLLSRLIIFAGLFSVFFYCKVKLLGFFTIAEAKQLLDSGNLIRSIFLFCFALIL